MHTCNWTGCYIFGLANSWQWLLFIEGVQCRTKRIIIEIDEDADADILVILKKVFTNAVSLFHVYKLLIPQRRFCFDDLWSTQNLQNVGDLSMLSKFGMKSSKFEWCVPSKFGWSWKSFKNRCFIPFIFGSFWMSFDVIQKWMFCTIHFWMVMYLPKWDVLYQPNDDKRTNLA